MSSPSEAVASTIDRLNASEFDVVCEEDGQTVHTIVSAPGARDKAFNYIVGEAKNLIVDSPLTAEIGVTTMETNQGGRIISQVDVTYHRE